MAWAIHPSLLHAKKWEIKSTLSGKITNKKMVRHWLEQVSFFMMQSREPFQMITAITSPQKFLRVNI